MDGNRRMNKHRLSEREIGILSQAAEGFGDKEIAANLGLSLGTVRTYWSRVRAKLNAATRSQAVGKFVIESAGAGQPQCISSVLGTFLDEVNLPAWEVGSSGEVKRTLNDCGMALYEQFKQVSNNWIIQLDESFQRVLEHTMGAKSSKVKITPFKCRSMSIEGQAVLLPRSTSSGNTIVVFFPN